jgi:hypothetical protein
MKFHSDFRTSEVEEPITSLTDDLSIGEADGWVRRVIALLAERQRMAVSQRIDARRRAGHAIKRNSAAGGYDNLVAMTTTSSRSAERSKGGE